MMQALNDFLKTGISCIWVALIHLLDGALRKDVYQLLGALERLDTPYPRLEHERC